MGRFWGKDGHCLHLYIHQAPVDSSKPMVIQMALMKLSRLQDTKRHECGKGTSKEEWRLKGDGRERCKGESENNQNEFCIYSKLSKKKLNKSYI